MKYTILYRMNKETRRMEAFLLDAPEDGRKPADYSRYGWYPAGTVETELSRDDLIQGLAVRIIEEKDQIAAQLHRIQDIANGVDAARRGIL